jgi:hypothetical protein
MGREGWIFLRAYAHAVALLGLAVLVMVLLGGLRAIPLLAGMFDVLRWVPIAIAGGACLLVCGASYRLWRWQRGDGPSCASCGGPLGHERQGRADRGGVFRACYACGKAVNHRHYE